MDVFVVGDDDQMRLLEVPDGCSDLAGPENWRQAVWGGPGVCGLGARFFPLLDGGDLTVQPEDVPEFLLECALLRDHMAQVVPDSNPRRPLDSHAQAIDSVSFRLANIRSAAERALAVGGGVLVW